MAILNDFKIRYLGIAPYLDVLNEQEALRAHMHERLVAGRQVEHHLLGLEHPSTITLGRRAKENSEILQPGNTPIIATQRGGLATVHSPGQLVIYPVVHLKSFGLSVREWVKLLLQSTTEFLETKGLRTQAHLDQAGVYSKLGKIAFIGVHISRGISTHGISLNVTNDLREFSRINICGMSEAKLDTMSSHIAQSELSLPELFNEWSVVFLENLRRIKTSFHAALIAEREGLIHASFRPSGPDNRNLRPLRSGISAETGVTKA